LVTIGSLIISVDQIKETIMKKIIFWTALISVVTLFIGACAKRDDTTITATAVTCDRTASGSITVGSETVSSSYLMFTGSTPVTGCMDMTGRSTEGLPTGTQSIKQERIITSSTSFVDYFGYFSDTACTSVISYQYQKYSSLSVGDQVSGLSTSGGRPSSAYKVTYKSDCATAKGETDAGTELLNYYYSNTGVYLTTGTEQTFSTETTQSTYNIWAAGNSGNSFYNGSSGTAYPSDWATNDTTYVK
jgi:hypothetical protein